jgi:hypothetical protein
MGLSGEEDYQQQQQLSPVAGTSESGGLGIYQGDGRHIPFGDKHQMLPE